jgi:hypothetical protein
MMFNLSTKYNWFANNYGDANMTLDVNASQRYFPYFRFQYLESLQSYAKCPAVIAMDRIGCIQDPFANIKPNGTGVQFRTNHWGAGSTSTSYDGANVAVLDGSVKWYSWNNGSNWSTNYCCLPNELAGHVYSGGATTRLYYGNGNNAFNGGFNMIAPFGKILQAN